MLQFVLLSWKYSDLMYIIKAPGPIGELGIVQISTEG